MQELKTAKASKKYTNKVRILRCVFITILLGGGLYPLLLVSAPAIAPHIITRPIDMAALPAPKADENRIVIPKIGINIPYGTGEAFLNKGAEWRAPSSGNPAEGGNFVIAAHRFSIQPSPLATIEKSPFYHIDSIQEGDHVYVDYQGKRYDYVVQSKFLAKPTRIEIENHTDSPTLTLYSCGLGGVESDRIVILGKPVNKT